MESVRARLGFVAGGLTVRVTLPDEKVIKGAVHALRSRGIVALFERDAAAPLSLGSTFDVDFEGGGLRARATFSVRMEAWQDANLQRACLFAPEDPETFESTFVEPFHRGELRRKSPRLSPDPKNPPAVGVGLEMAGRFVPGRIADISVDGLQLRIQLADAGSLASADHLCVRIAVPGIAPAIAVIGDVRQAHLVGDQISFGLRIAWDRTPDRARAEEALTAYVMQLQQRYLEARLKRPGVPVGA